MNGKRRIEKEKEREREKEREEKEARGRLFSSLSWTSPRSLSRLDVIKTKPQAGPPSRRLINCFVRDTSLFKRNWALRPPLSPLLLSYSLDHPAHLACSNNSYLFVQRVRTGVFSTSVTTAASRISQSEGRIRFRSPCPLDRRPRMKKRPRPWQAQMKKSIDRFVQSQPT